MRLCHKYCNFLTGTRVWMPYFIGQWSVQNVYKRGNLENNSVCSKIQIPNLKGVAVKKKCFYFLCVTSLSWSKQNLIKSVEKIFLSTIICACPRLCQMYGIVKIAKILAFSPEKCLKQLLVHHYFLPGLDKRTVNNSHPLVWRCFESL